MKHAKRLFSFRRMRRHASERGVALIFTLGILGLLTVMALGFASTAMLNRKIADNNANSQGARMIAKAGFERVLGALYEGKNVENIFSKTLKSGSGLEYRSADWLWKLDTKLDGYTVFELPSAYNPETDVSWQYVRDTMSDHSPKEIIGRFAYVTAVDKGKLDPSVHFGKSLDASLDTTAGRKGRYEWEINFADGVRDYNAAAAPEKLRSALKNATTDINAPRRWADMSEVFEKLSEGSSPLSDDDKEDLKTALETKQSPDSEAFWLDENNNGIKENEEFFHRFNIGPRDYQTTGEDGSVTTSSEWDQGTFDTADKLLNDARRFSENVAGNTTGEPDTGGIPWLKYWKETNGTWTADLMAKQIAANIIQYNRNINSSTVSDVSTDWATAGTNEPAYAGLGRHPYLNEAACALIVTLTLTETPTVTDGVDGPPYTYDYKYEPKLVCGTELIDIYGLTDGDDLPETSQVFFFGNISFDYMAYAGSYASGTNLDTFWKTAALNDTADHIQLGKKNLAKTTWTTPGRSYYTQEDTFWCDPTAGGGDELSTFPEELSGTFTSKTQLTAAQKAELFRIQNVKLYLRKAVLKCGNDDASLKQRDFARFADAASLDFSPENTADYTFSDGGQIKMFIRSYQAKDPRLNHYPSDWPTKKDYFATDEDKGKTDEYPGTRGKVNDDVNPSSISDGDKEKATDPAATGDHLPSLSTAYIRHAPMESLWELGAIHRAKAWQTLNLTTGKEIGKYTDGAARLGGGAYADGDANLLDQVKLTPKTAVYGKLNLNTDNHKLLYALFKGIKITTGSAADLFYATVTGTNEFSVTDCTESDSPQDACIACQIKDMPDMNTRVDMFASDDTANSAIISKIKSLLITGETDAEREQIIGKFINLTKADATDLVYVIVLGQTIKETAANVVFKNWIGTVNGATTHNPTNSVNDPIFKAYRRAGYVRPPRAGETKSTIFMPLGNIPSEQKLTDKISPEIGRYDLGADKITGEAKIIAVLFLDKSINKWKIQRFEYAE